MYNIYYSLIYNRYYGLPSSPVRKEKNLHAMQETQVQSRGGEDPLEKEMATHSSILACEIPRTEELGGLQPTVSQRAERD